MVKIGELRLEGGIQAPVYEPGDVDHPVIRGTADNGAVGVLPFVPLSEEPAHPEIRAYHPSLGTLGLHNEDVVSPVIEDWTTRTFQDWAQSNNVHNMNAGQYGRNGSNALQMTGWSWVLDYPSDGNLDYYITDSDGFSIWVNPVQWRTNDSDPEAAEFDWLVQSRNDSGWRISLEPTEIQFRRMTADGYDHITQTTSDFPENTWMRIEVVPRDAGGYEVSVYDDGFRIGYMEVDVNRSEFGSTGGLYLRCLSGATVVYDTIRVI